MATKSPASRSATSSATQPASKPPQSRYSLFNSGKAATGCHGAVALDTFNTRVDDEMVKIARGDFIPSEIVMTWPLANRLAMGTSARVRYFVSEAEVREMFPELEPAEAGAA
jgi:hypothetical protein